MSRKNIEIDTKKTILCIIKCEYLYIVVKIYLYSFFSIALIHF